MEYKIKEKYTASGPTITEINKLISISYNIAAACIKSKTDILLARKNISIDTEDLSEKISSSLFYLDKNGNIRLAEDHENVYKNLGNGAEFKFYLIETIRNKVKDALKNNFDFSN